MNPSSNNVFGDTPLGQGSILVSTPEKTTDKKWVIFVVIAFLILIGAIVALVIINRNAGEKRNVEGVETALGRLANYTYYGGDGYSDSISAMRPEQSYLMGTLMGVFDENVLQGYYSESLLLYDEYVKLSDDFYADEGEGKMLADNDAYMKGILTFLRAYTTNATQVTPEDYNLTEAEYLAKFSGISDLDSEVSRDYLELQGEIYRAGRSVFAIYSAKGCYQNSILSPECVDGLEYSADEADLLAELDVISTNLFEYPSFLVRKFYNRCLDNYNIIQGGEENA